MDGWVHCEWGGMGIEALKAGADVFILVDVLSFTTCVDVAVSRGASILPFAGNDDSVQEYVASMNAQAAVRSREKGYSLSPASVLGIPAGTRLVLPSPNGSALSLATGSIPMLAGCLRNARAVAKAASRMGKQIRLIAAGERWKDQSIRPGIEDFLGVGAIVSELHLPLSAEADLARIAFEGAKNRLGWFLEASVSGQELIERDRREDIRIAAEFNVSQCVPILRDSAYTRLEAIDPNAG